MQIQKFCIFVKISEQKLYFFADQKLVKIFDVSTSRAPASCIENSEGTPLGLHKIAEKIGDGEAADTVFKARKPAGRLADQSPEDKAKNLIMCRILRLRGLEEGRNSGGNVDSYARYVYMHGTNQEDKIGTPNSHGCILVKSADLLWLFENTPEGSLVFVEE